jgi:uncharacterized RDD family membrane protein YckC
MVSIQTGTGFVTLPEGVVLTSKGRRLLCALLEGVLAIVTLGIGYFIWQFFTYRTGQTPGKKLMGIRVVSLNDGKALPFWMTLLREWIVKGFIGGITFGIAYIWILFDAKNQTLYDKVLNTVVVDDPQGLTLSMLAPSIGVVPPEPPTAPPSF